MTIFDLPAIDFFSLVLVLVAAIVAAIISWKLSDFFLSRRDFYVNSPADIFGKKLNWAIFWFLFTITVGISIVNVQLKKGKGSKGEKHHTIAKEKVKETNNNSDTLSN